MNKYLQIVFLTLYFCIDGSCTENSFKNIGSYEFALNLKENQVIRIVPYQTNISLNNFSANNQLSVPTSAIKSTINIYYDAIFKEDYSTLSDLYTPTLDRYFDSFNISKYEAVKDAKNYKKRFKVISAYNKIYWTTLNVISTQDGNFQVSFNMDYFIQRINSNKSSKYNIDIIMTITKDLKIQSIYENIIEKN